MSVKIMGAVFDADLPPTEKFILLAYADHADHEGGNIYPSDSMIAWKTGFTRRHVLTIRLKLVSLKILLLEGKTKRRTNLYRLDVDALPRRESWQEFRKSQLLEHAICEPSSHIDGLLEHAICEPCSHVDPLCVKSDALMCEPQFTLTVIEPSNSEPSINPEDDFLMLTWRATLEAFRQTHGMNSNGGVNTQAAQIIKRLEACDLLYMTHGSAVIRAPTETEAAYLQSRAASSLARILPGILPNLDDKIKVVFQEPR